VDVVGRYHQVLRRFARTGPGLVARLRADGHREDVVVGALFFLLVAGQETTSQFLTLLLHRLAGSPALVADLVNGRVPVEDVVEEGLRRDPPIVTWRRVVGRDTELDGVALPAGTPLILWLAKANRDPCLVSAPDSFLPGQRGARRHLAFGAGAHRCLGAQLSRMEAAVVVAETAPLLRGVEVVRSPACPDNLSFRMPDALTVKRRAHRQSSSSSSMSERTSSRVP